MHEPWVLLSAAALAGIGLGACNADPTPGQSATTASAALSSPSASPSAPTLTPSADPASVTTAAPTATATATATAAPAASASASAITVAALQAEAAADPARFTGKSASLDGYFARQSQTRSGSGEHPVHSFAVVHVALTPGGSDTIACQFEENLWPPRGLQPGEPISVTGTWSTHRMLRGGIVPTGGALLIWGCKLTRKGAGQ